MIQESSFFVFFLNKNSSYQARGTHCHVQIFYTWPWVMITYQIFRIFYQIFCIFSQVLRVFSRISNHCEYIFSIFPTAILPFLWILCGSIKGQSMTHRWVYGISLDLRINHKSEHLHVIRYYKQDTSMYIKLPDISSPDTATCHLPPATCLSAS